MCCECVVNVLSKMNLFLRIILPLILSRACVLKLNIEFRDRTRLSSGSRSECVLNVLGVFRGSSNASQPRPLEVTKQDHN